MHSRIFQVSKKPIDCEMWPDADCVAEYSSPMFSIDYAVTISNHNERKGNIAALVDDLMGMFTLNPDGFSMTYNGGMDAWKTQYIESIKEQVAMLDEKNVFHSAQLYCIQSAIKHPLGSRLFVTDENEFATDSNEFMEWVDGLDAGDVVYFGAVMDYHY